MVKSLRYCIVAITILTCAVFASAQEQSAVVQPVVDVGNGDGGPVGPATQSYERREFMYEIASNWLPNPLQNTSIRALDSSLLLRTQIENHSQNDRGSSLLDVRWIAPSTYSKPTYFEDIDLENYGHRKHWQIPRSAVKFFGGFPMLPLKMMHQPPHKCIYRLGPDRPGNRNCSVKEKRFR